MVIDPLLLQFWGKTPRANEPVEHFHPAICHMLDVACVAEALLRDGAPRLRRALLHAWRGCDPDALIAWLPFLIATHDLGKISAAFQGQVEPQRVRLAQAGVRFNTRQVELYHAAVSAVWLHDHLIEHEPGTSERLMWALRDAMGGHHGRFTQESMREFRQRLHASERGETRWPAWREQTYALLRELLAPAIALADLGEPHALRPATVALTGLIVWCDWMGSNESDFPASPGVATAQYLAEARRRAAAALQAHRIDARRPVPTYHTFSTLFPDICNPRPLQELIDTLPADDLGTPSLTVIEAPTGEGKTEAALALARRIAAARGIDEIFFALPTMATGNQMFTRLEVFYRQQYGDDGLVRLTHSQAIVVEQDLRRRVALSSDHDRFDIAGRSLDAALEWFVGPKKAMLAPFGVGTVDQVELGGLNVRHYALRLFGLAGKMVVIDEVHAYDTYMSTILDHTLAWLASLGCSVILLSATLPVARHQALATAFLRGLGDLQPPVLPAEPPYPSLSLYHTAGCLQQTCAVFRGAQCFTLRLAKQRTREEEAAYLLDLVRDGGAVARLCNRVDDAQALYRELLEHLPAAQRVLLHARFPLHQRREREHRVEQMVGKQTTRSADQPLIIVGTQVLEQSLDYDVDMMISDFAPIDLLLQRAGRLHRHDRAGKRPARHTTPVLEVTLPTNEADAPIWKRWAPIYAPYILWRSWEVLRERMVDNRCEIVLPRDYRPLIEAVYGDSALISASIHVDAIARDQERYQRAMNEQQAQARRPLIPDVRGTDAITDSGGYEFIDDESGAVASWQLAKTRLGDQISLVPVYRVDGELALDPGGTFRLSADIPPDLERQKELIDHAVPVSDRRIIAAYRDERRARELRWPWSARELPALLRSLHPLPLDRSTHSFAIEDRILRLDPELGLVIGQADQYADLILEEDDL